MNIEERIREIVREELAKAQHAKLLMPKTEPNLACYCHIDGVSRTMTCGHAQCPLRPPFVAYTAAPVYNPPGSGMVVLDENVPSGTAVIVNVTKELSVSRTGCACPPGTVASCPDKACPWKS